MKIVLASQSPRRREILDLMGIKYRCQPSSIDESTYHMSDPKELVSVLAKEKGLDVLKTSEVDEIIISADTVVAFEEHVLGKPTHDDEARLFLQRLSGKTHSVYTGMTMMKKGETSIFTSCIETRVKMKAYNEATILKYIATKEPLDKAGAYAIQGKGSMLVDYIEGDYYNVMGLSVQAVIQGLAFFGVKDLDWL